MAHAGAVAHRVVLERQVHRPVGHIGQAAQAVVGQVVVLHRAAGLHRALEHLAPGLVVGVAADLVQRGIGDLQQLAELEDKTEGLAMRRDTFSRNTRNQLKQVFDALRELKSRPVRPSGPSASSTPRTRARRPRDLVAFKSTSPAALIADVTTT